MQVRAVFEAACRCARDGADVHPEVMIPLVAHVAELREMRAALEEEARSVMTEQGIEVPYHFGTMIEIPRAAITAAELAKEAEFFSFGTNDLTRNPFETIDREGVGQLMAWAVEKGKAARPDLEVGICGEHGGDPASIALCHELGLDYVSCSPFRVPIARLAAAHAALAEANGV
jgi:pyruvate,orthophosphate dikinase